MPDATAGDNNKWPYASQKIRLQEVLLSGLWP